MLSQHSECGVRPGAMGADRYPILRAFLGDLPRKARQDPVALAVVTALAVVALWAALTAAWQPDGGASRGAQSAEMLWGGNANKVALLPAEAGPPRPGNPQRSMALMAAASSTEPVEPDALPDALPGKPAEPDALPDVLPAEPNALPDVLPGEPDALPGEPAEPDVLPAEPAEPDALPPEPAEPDALPAALPAEPAEPNALPDGETPDAAWAFPFDPPVAPEEDGNQALAVNTTDGSVTYSAEFALVWADDGEPVATRNEAYALANCTSCAAVAVAFQVVLIEDPPDVIAPQNHSAAVNYNCVGCDTHALASQLVLTVDPGLSDDGMEQLSALWADIDQYGSNLDNVPPAEIQGQLEAYKGQITAVVQPGPSAAEDGAGRPAEGVASGCM